MKSKIIFSIFILFIFILGLAIGLYGGVKVGASRSVTELWAGAKIMQGAISYIDQQKPDKARSLLCNSIKTRVEIMDFVQPIKSRESSNEIEELEHYVFGLIEEDKSILTATCP
ncbi:hypothetical protein [Thalassotalea profundi]|uniref:Uncharacterized protein n=1 Tax=Thalassotalea profundi TaxID=2036687 RepID=A0ABQ3IPB9_9GAMM|nr:hypothetical protein [Thalassotalea profundi]GHE85476.1 hypothetical protein GCM10011501_13150 [Thalassotalea profundi]